MMLLGAVDDPDGDEITPIAAGLDLDITGFGVIEKGVRDLVTVLWNLGYRTVCSCAGHARGIEPYPCVAILIDGSDDGKRLQNLLMAVARYNISLGEDGWLPEALRTWVFVPMNGPAGLSVYLQPYDSNSRREAEKISKLREDSRRLARFIEKQCSDIFEPKAQASP